MRRRHRGLEQPLSLLHPTCLHGQGSSLPSPEGLNMLTARAKLKINHHPQPPPGQLCPSAISWAGQRQGSGEIPLQPSEKPTVVFLWVIKHTALLSNDFGIMKVFATGIFLFFFLSCHGNQGMGALQRKAVPHCTHNVFAAHLFFL